MSKRSPHPKQHNHVNKIMALIQEGALRAEPGSIQSIDVAHDDWCLDCNQERDGETR